MNKKIREEVIALAKKIIAQDKKQSTTSLKEKAHELYERLTVLEFLEAQSGLSEQVFESDSLDSKSFREENWFIEPVPIPQPENKEEITEPLIEKIKDIVAQMPSDTQQVDELLDKILPDDKNAKDDLAEFAASYQETPTFERKEPEKDGGSTKIKSKSINDSLHKGLQIGLNDRLAFVKHLFEGETEDYARVLSQIGTMNSYDEVASFIIENVRPDYNNWENKEEYSNRFLAIIEKSFNS